MYIVQVHCTGTLYRYIVQVQCTGTVHRYNAQVQCKGKLYGYTVDFVSKLSAIKKFLSNVLKADRRKSI